METGIGECQLKLAEESIRQDRRTLVIKTALFDLALLSYYPLVASVWLTPSKVQNALDYLSLLQHPKQNSNP